MNDTYAIDEAPSKGHRYLPAALTAIVFAGALLAHGIYVSLYATSLPFWDQWDEIARFLVPWFTGHWHIGLLFPPHNEHRIAFTRLVTLGLFALNGQHWDNLVEAYANCIIYATQFSLLYALLCRNASARMRLAMAICVLCVIALPYDWENTLIGFQNQFYFMCITATAMLAISAWRRESAGTFWLLCLLGAASLFTMASGVLAAPAVIAVIVLRQMRTPSRTVFPIAAILAMAVITIVGLKIIPHIAGHDALQAQGIGDWLHAIFMTMMWPIPPFSQSTLLYVIPALFIWLPGLIWLIRFLRSRSATEAELLAAGLVAWSALQVLAIAHSRGHEMGIVPYRYTDILAVGFLANAWFALRMLGPIHTTQTASRIASGTTIAFFVFAIWGFTRGTVDGMSGAQGRYDMTSAQTIVVNDYLNAHDANRFLRQPGMFIPYIHAEPLRRMLDDPTIRVMLPPSLHPASQNSHDIGLLSAFFGKLQQTVRRLWGATESMPHFQSARRAAANTSPPKIKALCSLDTVNYQLITVSAPVTAGAPISLAGWLADDEGKAPSTFRLVLKGPEVFQVDGRTGGKRPDVAKALHSALAESSGFNFTATLPDDLPPGNYRVLMELKSDGLEEMCDTKKSINMSSGTGGQP